LCGVQNQKNALRKREGQLREDIDIFNITLPDSADLSRLEKVCSELWPAPKYFDFCIDSLDSCITSVSQASTFGTR
jgi:hypothetical protein